MAAGDWTRDEVEATVADYFAMLESELNRRRYSKAEHNRRLQAQTGRSHGSIEFKHQNITAILRSLDQPIIRGYAPRGNYQLLLEQVVREWLDVYPRFFEQFADGPVLAPKVRPGIPEEKRPSGFIVPPPGDMSDVGVRNEVPVDARFARVDFVRRDPENRRLGRLGEEWVLEFERRRLQDEERRPDLAKKIEWVADTRGDGAGFDISSFNADATPRLIEVKTTGLGRHFPFTVTSNEVRVSERRASAYSLYRVFDFATQARLYLLPGALTVSCHLEPTQYRARAGRLRRD